ncbi:hypothetical protein ACFLVE_02245 [Chloroflexota bacterium]
MSLEPPIDDGVDVFLHGSVATLFDLFPQSIIGAMLPLVKVELTDFVRDIRNCIFQI